MKIGVIGLGRMGAAVAQRLVHGHHDVYGYDPDEAARMHAAEHGITTVTSLKALSEQARIFWFMVPHGDIVDQVIDDLLPYTQSGDIIIDGGNSFYKRSQARAQRLASHGISFLDCGTSGGIWGEQNGFCLMIGGDKSIYERMENIFAVVAAPDGYAYMGGAGTGHYVKMVHNGIEYGIMQAYAEGIQIIKEGTFKDENLDLELITGIWQKSSVIRSFLLNLLHTILKNDQELHTVIGEVAEGGTGSWTMQEAQEHQIMAPALQASLAVRAASRKTGGNYATKLLALMREAFGGHIVKRKK